MLSKLLGSEIIGLMLRPQYLTLHCFVNLSLNCPTALDGKWNLSIFLSHHNDIEI
jgi:hypothetical protein